MPYLLNCLFLLLLVIFSPWLAYAAIRKGKYRDGWGEKFLGRVPRRSGDRPCIWLHAVSVGEVNLLQPLLAELAQRKPTWECVISTTTRTGFALARRKYAGYHVFYCPLDFTWAVRRAMRRVRPALLVLAELELWPNLIHAARRRGARVALVNGRISEHSYRGYRRVRPFIRPMVSRLHLIAVQNEQYAERFRELGAPPERVRVTGSVKFDGAETRRHNPATQHLRQLWKLTDSQLVFLAGSTQEPEEEMALNAFRHALMDHPHARLILVPRHPERFDLVARMLDRSGLPWQRRSQLETSTDTPSTHVRGRKPTRVLLVDVIGELGAWWGTAHIGFVGGSMGARGGQNMIEPAGYGVATCFGPHTTNFRDIVALLLSHRSAVVVHNEAELEAFLARSVREPEFLHGLGRRAQQLVMAQQGATQRTLEYLLPLIAEP